MTAAMGTRIRIVRLSVRGSLASRWALLLRGDVGAVSCVRGRQRTVFLLNQGSLCSSSMASPLENRRLCKPAGWQVQPFMALECPGVVSQRLPARPPGLHRQPRPGRPAKASCPAGRAPACRHLVLIGVRASSSRHPQLSQMTALSVSQSHRALGRRQMES